MKKNKKVLPQLNKSSVLKLVIFIAIIVLIEVAAGLFIFGQVSKNLYNQEYSAFSKKADALTDNVYSDYSSSIENNDFNSTVLASIS